MAPLEPRANARCTDRVHPWASVAALDRAEALASEGGVRAALPPIAEERGRLARALADDAEAEQRLRGAQQQFTEVGAEGHARRLAAELGG